MNILEYNTKNSQYFAYCILFAYIALSAIQNKSSKVGMVFLLFVLLFQFIKSYIMIAFLSIFLAEMICWYRNVYIEGFRDVQNETSELKVGYETKLDVKDGKIKQQQNAIDSKNTQINSLGKNISILQNERGSLSNKISENNRKIRRLRNNKRSLEAKTKRIADMSRI